jgi:hypothetical protein
VLVPISCSLGIADEMRHRECYDGKTASRLQDTCHDVQVPVCPPIEIPLVRDICSVRLGKIGHRVVERIEE